MKLLRYILVFAVTIFAGYSSYGQMIQDPTTWKVEVKNKGGANYDVVFHLALKAGWHVYAKNKGMDESLIVPSFTFDKNANVTVIGETAAKGIVTTKNIEGVGPVSMYTDQVIYTQHITGKKGAKVTGNYIYQTCNDSICLPPFTKTFSVVIK